MVELSENLFKLMNGAKEINFNVSGFSFSKSQNSFSSWLQRGKPVEFGSYTNFEWDIIHTPQYQPRIRYYVYPPIKEK